MKNEQQIREILLQNTIRLIAEGGFEKATTHAIAYSGDSTPDIKMNEVYIYRLFGSKEKLYEAAFATLEKELTDAIWAGGSLVRDMKTDTKSKLNRIFTHVWEFVMKSEQRCRCYIRFYYSVYFKGAARREHTRLFDRLIRAFSPLFKEEADVNAIMHSVFTTLLDFAIRVYNGDLENSEINVPHVFNVLYCMMMTYFKEEIRASEQSAEQRCATI